MPIVQQTDVLKYRLESTNRSIAVDNILKHGIVGIEFFNYFCGGLLGFGCHRDVFEFKPEPKWVIKIEHSNSDRNANVIEDEVWAYAQNYVNAKWFAPVKKLSPCGRILLQRRCITNVDASKYPRKIPEFFTDVKYANWGMLDGKMVCFDYANNLLMQTGLGTKNMKVAKWR